MTSRALLRSLLLSSSIALAIVPGEVRADQADAPLVALPDDYVPPELRNVEIKEHLGDTLPLDVRLRDESGADVELRQYFSGKRPVVINFVYHSCPTLCSFVQSGFAGGIKHVPWDVGTDYEILTVSIDPRDTLEIIREKKEKWVSGYGRDRMATNRGWHFLSGNPEEVKRLASAVGFSYAYDARDQQYAHPAGLFVITPAGKISRYLYGIEFQPKDLRLALTEASEGRAASTVDHLLLYCYRYDPNARSYTLVAWRVMRVGAAATMTFLAVLLGTLWLRERTKKTPPSRPSSDEAKAPTSEIPSHVEG
jgi:protein SCO1